MCEVIVIGDPHIRKNNIHLMQPALDEIVDVVKKRKPRMTVILGDTLDTHERIDMKALNIAINFFKQLSKFTKLIVLIGNHDRINNSDFMSDIHPFVGLDDIIIVSKTIKIDNDVFVPYVPNGRFFEALEGIEYKDARYIFCHQEFKGCRMKGITSKKGDIWSEDLPPIISGHIHEYQILGNITYVGTFIQQNYGESIDKAIMSIDKDGNRERIKLSSTVMRETVNLTLDNIYEWRDLITEGYLTRIVITLDVNDVKELKSNKEYLEMEKYVDKIDLHTINKKTTLSKNLGEGMINAIDIIMKLLETDELKDIFRDEINI